MAPLNDNYLCNGLPIDHRLQRFLASAKQKHRPSVNNQAEIIENFGNTMVRDDGSCPTADETSFASWLAKPDMTGGLVIALQQPAKLQKYDKDMESIVADCDSLAYLDKSLAFVSGSEGLKTTSVFDAFPFITEKVSWKNEKLSRQELSSEAELAYDTFISMVEAKKPDILFACWRIDGHYKLDFSGAGIGNVQSESIRLPNGHVVNVVNGFHPSFVANYHPNESCFRRLFTMELCQALCKLRGAWEEESWMEDLRRTCREKVSQLRQKNSKSTDQFTAQLIRQLRGSRDSTSRKYQAYTQSFDNGLTLIKQLFKHMISPIYQGQTSHDLYSYLNSQNTSHGICDALLAVSHAMPRYASSTFNSDSALVDLGEHIRVQSLAFIERDIAALAGELRGSSKTINLWDKQFKSSTSTGLKSSLEKLTIRFVGDVTKAFAESQTTWTPQDLQDAFKGLAVAFEKALGKEVDESPELVGTGVTDLSESLNALSLSPPRSLASRASRSTSSSSPSPPRSSRTQSSSYLISPRTTTVQSRNYAYSSRMTPPTSPPRTTTNNKCYNCALSGHFSSACPLPPKKASLNSKCYNCNQLGHFANECPSPRKAQPVGGGGGRLFAGSVSGKCYTCGEEGHWSSACGRTRGGTGTGRGVLS